MKIIIIPSWYPYPSNPVNGTFFKDHAESLAAAGHDVTVAAAEIASLKTAGKILSDCRVNIRTINGVKTYQHIYINRHPRNPGGFFKRYQKVLKRLLDKVIENEGLPDIIHVHSSLWAGAALASYEDINVPFVVTEHLKEFLIPGGFSPFQISLIKDTYKHAKAVIAPSTAVMQSIEKIFSPPDSCNRHIVGNMVNTDFFKPLAEKPFTNRFTFIMVCLLRKEKQIPQIIRAFSPIANTHLAKIRIVGDGPEYHAIKDEIAFYSLERQVEIVRETGRDSVLHHLQLADVFLLYSQMETFGVSVIEALSCGLPAICSKCGGPEDIINNKNGLLVDSASNLLPLSEAMKKIFIEHDKYDADTIRRDMIERFSIDTIITKLSSIYADATG